MRITEGNTPKAACAESAPCVNWVNSRKARMSQHIVEQGEKKYVFGWDHPLQSFYLQVHDLIREDPDENPVVWLGATAWTSMYEVEELVSAAQKHGLFIDRTLQAELYGEKDDGR